MYVCMYVCVCVPQVEEGQAATDHRFFIRTIIRHSDFVTTVSHSH